MFAISEALFLMVILSWVTKELLCIKQVLKQRKLRHTTETSLNLRWVAGAGCCCGNPPLSL